MDFRGKNCLLDYLPDDLTVSKRTGTSNRIEIQFRTFNHLSRPDSFVKLFETLWDKFEILQLVPDLFRVPRSPGMEISPLPPKKK
jgi:hypothetical protein